MSAKAQTARRVPRPQLPITPRTYFEVVELYGVVHCARDHPAVAGAGQELHAEDVGAVLGGQRQRRALHLGVVPDNGLQRAEEACDVVWCGYMKIPGRR